MQIFIPCFKIFKFIKRFCLEAGNLLLESGKDRKVLLNPENNNIGISVIIQKEYVIVVEIIAKKLLMVSAILEGEEEGEIEVHGRMLVDDRGLFAISLYNVYTEEPLLRIDPEHIRFDRETKEFVILLATSTQNIISMPPQYYIDFYVRHKPEQIQYGTSSGEKIDDKFLSYKILQKSFKVPCMEWPLYNYQEEDAEDRMKRHQEKILRGKHE